MILSVLILGFSMTNTVFAVLAYRQRNRQFDLAKKTFKHHVKKQGKKKNH